MSGRIQETLDYVFSEAKDMCGAGPPWQIAIRQEWLTRVHKAFSQSLTHLPESERAGLEGVLEFYDAHQAVEAQEADEAQERREEACGRPGRPSGARRKLAVGAYRLADALAEGRKGHPWPGAHYVIAAAGGGYYMSSRKPKATTIDGRIIAVFSRSGDLIATPMGREALNTPGDPSSNET